eukprot:Gb_09968 [translate_table: standard]
MELRMVKLEEQMERFIARLDNFIGKRTKHPKQESNIEEASKTKGVRQCFLPTVEIRKFDRKDVRIWLSQMEQYFNLHQVPADKKITLASLHMETKPFQWYQWMKKKWGGLSYRWDNFVDDIIAQYDNAWEADYFSQLTKIKMAKQIEAKNKATQKTVGVTSIEGRKHVDTQGPQEAPPPTHVISSHRMEKLIKKGAPGIIARCYSIEGYEETESVTPKLQEVLSHHSKTGLKRTFALVQGQNPRFQYPMKG